MNEPISRRVFLAGSLALGACRPRIMARTWTGDIVGASHSFGHLLREAPKAATVQAETADVVIVGGGMAGLIAALRLKQAGRGVIVLELEKEVGGNSASGTNATSSFPWGAHYVPVPSTEMVDVCALLEEFGLGRPGQWNEEALCHDPNERLWYRGKWHEGLMPSYGLDEASIAETNRFFARMEEFKNLRGNDGRRAFAIPVDDSSKDPSITGLDSITMADWLAREGFTNADLLWHVDYGCRDDYGAGIRTVSAWAGIHYHASRTSSEVFTWPQGNGWLVAKLRERLEGCLLPGHLVTRIEPDGRVEAVSAGTGKPLAWQANAVVCAAPRFIANRLIPGLENKPSPAYAPWMVANLTVLKPVSATWDNVLREAKSLGYVVATHQNLTPAGGPTVLTYYQPLDHLPPAEARKEALAKSYADWCRDILTDLSGPHPDLRQNIIHLDVWLWGHAMALPVPGFIHGSTRAAMNLPVGKIHFAHSDMSGLSLFEEACHWGHHAARSILSNA